MKKRLTLILALCALIAVIALAMVGCNGSEEVVDEYQTLIVYNWGDYIGEDIEDDFEAYYKEYYKEKYGKNIELDLVYSTFETNEIMLTTVERGEEKIDLVCPSEYAIQRLMQGGYLQKLDYGMIPNKSNVNQEIYDKVDEVFTGIAVPGESESQNMSDYFVPYMWGTLGILYNKEKVTEEDIATGYGILWNAAGNPELDGKILMKDSIRDSYVAAVLRLKELGRLPAGYEDIPIDELINTVDDTLLAYAEKIFNEQSSVIKGYEVDFGKAQMTSDRAYVDLAWSGDALWAMEDADYLDYYVPEIGGNVWFDGWCMLNGIDEKHKEAALVFIDYMCRPDISMRNSMAIGYTSAIAKEVVMASEEACAILEENDYDPEEYFADENRYPTIKDSPLSVMKDFGAQNAATISMWERVKSNKEDTSWVGWVIGAVSVFVVAAVVVFVIIFKYNRERSRRLIKPAPSKE